MPDLPADRREPVSGTAREERLACRPGDAGTREVISADMCFRGRIVPIGRQHLHRPGTGD
jgi:hypothetical protein